jgi:ribosomal protein L37E
MKHSEAKQNGKTVKARRYMCNSCGIESQLEYCGKCGRDTQPIRSPKQMREDFDRRMRLQRIPRL